MVIVVKRQFVFLSLFPPQHSDNVLAPTGVHVAQDVSTHLVG